MASEPVGVPLLPWPEAPSPKILVRDEPTDCPVHERVEAPCGCVFPMSTKSAKALTVLADFEYTHARYYGAKGQTDFRY